MQERYQRFCYLFLCLLLTLAACASQQPLVTIGPAKGEAVVEVKASSFRFEPNNIKAYKGDVLVFRIENTSGSEHNFSVKGPDGSIIQSVVLPAGQTTQARIPLTATGTYEFYCDKPFHSGFGLKGQIVVADEP